MSGMRKHSGVVKTYTVWHPEHGEFTAKGVRDKLQAVQAAAKAWGLQWSAIARECVFSSQSCEAPSEKAELQRR